MAVTLAEVMCRFGPEYLQSHRLGTAQARAWRAIVACRTSALGGVQLRCENCSRSGWRWHSCRNRHCPQCQHREREAWRAARLAETLDVPYCHLVFTLPHELNGLAAWHPRWVYDTLLRTVAATLSAFAANPRWLGGTPAFSLVLHTWTQDLRRHLHVHALMACGALATPTAGEAGGWVSPTRSPRFLFPVHALSRVFRGRFLQALTGAETAGRLGRDPADSPRARRVRLQALRRHDWVVYARTPLAGPGAVIDYLSRYTHRNAIGNERLIGIDAEGVRIRVRADHRGAARIVHLAGDEFIGRFLQHVLPGGFKRIRHYGLLAAPVKARRLALARAALRMPAPNPQAREDVAAFMKRVAALDIGRCPLCRAGRLAQVQVVLPRSRPLAGPFARAAHAAAHCRDPP